jgi:hypothetical protein
MAVALAGFGPPLAHSSGWPSRPVRGAGRSARRIKMFAHGRHSFASHMQHRLWRFGRGNGSGVVNCSPDVMGMPFVILAATMAVHSVSNSGWSL